MSVPQSTPARFDQAEPGRLTPSLLLSLAREHFLDLIENAPHVRESMERIIDGYLADWAARDPEAAGHVPAE